MEVGIGEEQISQLIHEIKTSEVLGLSHEGERQIEQPHVIELAQQLGQIYHVPKEQVEHAQQVPVYLSSLKNLQNIAGDLIIDSGMEHSGNLPDWEVIQRFIEEFKLYQGITLPIGGKRTIYINAEDWNGESPEEFFARKDPIIRHELLHELARSRINPRQTGFKHEGKNERWNEAATQTLELIDRCNGDFDKAYDMLLNPSEVIPYKAWMKCLMGAMRATSGSPNPMTIQDLAKYYFSDADTNLEVFKKDLVGRTPKEVREQVNNLLRNLDSKPQEDSNMPKVTAEKPVVANSAAHDKELDSPTNILLRMWKHLWGS